MEARIKISSTGSPALAVGYSSTLDRVLVVSVIRKSVRGRVLGVEWYVTGFSGDVGTSEVDLNPKDRSKEGAFRVFSELLTPA